MQLVLNYVRDIKPYYRVSNTRKNYRASERSDTNEIILKNQVRVVQ